MSQARVEQASLERAVIQGEIDRIGPTRCPAGRTSMRQIWETLLFLHWEVEPAALQALLPPELTLDTYEGKAYVGLVPFTMRGVRPTWAPPVWGLSNFHETNVRTYVHREGKEPGVWFFSLDAANSIAVWLARQFWHLPYYKAKMSLREDAQKKRIEYETQRLWPEPTPAKGSFAYTLLDEPKAAEVGTLEHFLAERYILYAKRKGHLYLGRVHHVPYPLQHVELHHWEEDLLAASKIERPNVKPMALFARQVRVKVFPLEKIL